MSSSETYYKDGKFLNDTKVIRVGTDDYTYYPGADKFTVTVSSAAAGKQYAAYLLKGTDAAPTQSNMLDIRQTASTGTSATFEVIFPMDWNSEDPGAAKLLISSSALANNIVVPLYYVVASDQTTKLPTYDIVQYILGDVNNDGVWDLDDAILALQFGAHIVTPTAIEFKAADVNKDGISDLDDAIAILQYGAHIINSFDSL